MLSPQTSTLLLTLLLAIGLVFFLRAASKDRTTVVDVASPRPPLEVLEGVSSWLEQRGWSPQAVALMVALQPRQWRPLLRWGGRWRHAVSPLTARDLIASG